MSTKKRRTLSLLLFGSLLAAGYLAVSVAGDGKTPVEELNRPTATPDRIILTWTADPATTQAVTWRTSTNVDNPVAQIAVAEDGPDFPEKAEKVDATSVTLESDLSTAKYHTAEFSGLEPRTLYAYRVGDGSNWSEWNQFRTASDRPDPLTFIYVGDAQNNIYEMWSRVIRMGFTHAPQANFILHAGDLVNKANRDEEWGEWFRSAGWINRSMPSVATPGNHEYDDGMLTGHWRPTFALPSNGLPALAESNYYVDIQGVRMVAMNSNEHRAEQAEWLDSVLADNPNRWTIITYHHPLFSSARGRDNAELRESWQPVFDKHHVDLVLQGHDHSYGRSNLLTGVNAQEGAFGTVYVVSVSGPKMYPVENREWMERNAGQTQLFQVIRIDGDKLDYEARTARGVLYDAFELHKQADKPNRLINKVPPTPARGNEKLSE